MQTGILHVASGHSTTRLIEAAGLPGRTSVWADPLHAGPVPAGIDDDELVRVRAAHLASALGVSGDIERELRGWREALDSGAPDEPIVLWYEHDLFDQLNLLQVLDRLASAAATRDVTLVTADSFPGRAVFKGFGELTPVEIASLYPSRQPITARQYDLARQAWTAFRSPDPRAIAGLLAGDTADLPFLGPSLGRFLEDFPSITNGLGRTEQRLLDVLSEGPADIGTLMSRLHAHETHFYIADASLWVLVAELAATSPPLVDVRADDAQADAWTDTISITPAGEDVRQGRGDRAAMGLDRWMGGVHLTGTAAWRWTGRELTCLTP